MPEPPTPREPKALLDCDPPAPTTEEEAKALVQKDETWKRIQPRLLLFAATHIQEHQDPRDFVQDAIEGIQKWARTGAGRTWSWQAEPSLTRATTWIVWSVISHHLDSAHERHHGGSIHRDGTDDEGHAMEDMSPTHYPWGAPVNSTNPEVMHYRASTHARGVERVAKVEARLDELALKVFQDIVAGEHEPAQLAAKLALPVRQIYLAYKRVKHHIEKVVEEDQDPPPPNPLPDLPKTHRGTA